MDKKGKRRVATIGTFDGLHRGHKRVLSQLKATAARMGLEPMVICFDRHPLETIAPHRAPLFIQCPSERTNQLYREGLSILTLEFTPQIAALTAREWMERMHSEYGVDALIVGYDNTFGRDGVNFSLADYKQLGREVGVEIIEASYEPHAASSAIRRLVKEGEIPEANALLGDYFTIIGRVVAGKHLGASLGYPTANVEPSYRAQMPKTGVYAVEVMIEGEIAWRKAVANVGRQPSVSPDEPERLEVHIPGFAGNLYGQRLSVRFLRHLRDEMKFPSLEELKAQIAADIDSLTTKP